ncbi:hypothetical protein ACF07V_26945 [Streptomyces sp. NPDC015661]|uniref:hypothetical protein n=1 Tax=Streptomyces sp. NPDC015661 TaxID=3364961 RepID=UPI0036F4BC4E
MRTNRVLLAAAAAVTAFALTGCGGGGGNGAGKIPTAGDGTSSAGTGKGKATTGSGNGNSGGNDEVAAYVEAQRAWVTCLRAGGIDAPDPNENGQVELPDGRAIKSNPTLRKTLETCSKKQMAVPEGIERRTAPKLTPEQIELRFKFADCMQKNGAPDFPDPEPDGNTYGDQQWNQTSAGAKQAGRICRPVIGEPADEDLGSGKG